MDMEDEYEGEDTNESDTEQILNDATEDTQIAKASKIDLKPTPWWSHNDQVFFNTNYDEHIYAQDLLKKADIIVVFFGVYAKRNQRLIGKYLSRFQKRVNNSGGRLQLIFSSMDENEQDCQLFSKKLEGDWLIVPWANQAARRNTRNQCGVIRPPAVVACKNEEEGIVVSTEGKVEILEFGEEAYRKWKSLTSTPPHSTDPDAI